MGSNGVLGVGRWGAVAIVVAIIGMSLRLGYGSWDRDSAVELFREMSDRLGFWAIPAYVGLHTLTLALCLPYAVFLEAGASLLFGFFPAVLCVFSAKILAASLSFWIGRLVFRSSTSATQWAHRNRYFHVLSRGVERDGWRFVLLARFSPIPSYVINYALAATKVGFVMDFLVPTVIGCLPMILQNTSIGSLASAAVAASTTTTTTTTESGQKSKVWSYIFPLLGILSSILISLRIKKYSTDLSAAVSSPTDDDDDIHDSSNKAVDSSRTSSVGKRSSKPLEKSR